MSRKISKSFTFSPEVLSILQEVADQKHEGNLSRAVRDVVLEWDETRKQTAKQNGEK